MRNGVSLAGANLAYLPFSYGTKMLDHVSLLPWQKDVLIQMFRGEKKTLIPPPGIERGGGKTYMGAILAYMFITWAALDWAKVIVVDPTGRLRSYLETIINDSPMKDVFNRRVHKIWIEGYEDTKFVLFMRSVSFNRLMGFFGNLLFILDGDGRPYPIWAEKIIAASISSDNCYVYRT